MAEQVRPPIVTILGHVDHGKTTLLDYIRKTSVAAKEHGGITQHIGAYQAIHEGKVITFIDTPGHAAFEKMRSRGAKVADIAVLVIAADDGVMPQTVEAIKHIQEVKVPLIVAVTKIDLPGVNLKIQLEKIKKQLSDRKILIEEYGGDVPVVTLSAKTGEGVDKLLEVIILMAEIHEIKGDPTLPAAGVVIESSLDKFKGAVATILIRSGTLKKGDTILLNGIKSRVRGLFDYSGKNLDAAGQSTPVEVLGLEEVPAVGAILGEESLKDKSSKEVQSLVEKLREIGQKLNVIIKADKQGSLEAIIDALNKFNPSADSASSLLASSGQAGKVVDIVSSGMGDIFESDIKLASSVRAIVIGFNVKVAPAAQKLAEVEQVLVRTYTIIYELIEEIEDVVEGMLKVGQLEEVLGRAEIIAEFPYGKAERIAGCRMLEGTIAKGQKLRVVRDEKILEEVKIKSLKKVKEEVQKVEKGNECGIIFDSPVEFHIGDFVESFRVI